MAWQRGEGRASMEAGMWPAYVPVAERARRAEEASKALAENGERALSPVHIEGRAIATTFWGKAWCAHLESFHDFESRLPRGRRYVRNGSVIHLEVGIGVIKAHVQGSDTYDVTIAIGALDAGTWAAITAAASGQVGSLVELLEGKIDKSVMELVTRQEAGLFPKPGQIKMDCSCPDYARMCKHIAAVLYGVGARLDASPDLLFVLRGVDAADLVAKAAAARVGSKAARKGARVLATAALADVFGIELDEAPAAVSATVTTKARTVEDAGEAKPKAVARSRRRKRAESMRP